MHEKCIAVAWPNVKTGCDEWPDETVTRVGTLCNTTTHKGGVYCDQPTATVGPGRLVADLATTRVGNSIGAAIARAMEDHREVKPGLEATGVTGFDEGLAVAVQGEQAAVTIGVI